MKICINFKQEKNKTDFLPPRIEIITTTSDKVICESFGTRYAGYKTFDYGELFN